MAGKRVADGAGADLNTQEWLDALQQMQDPACNPAAIQMLLRACRHALNPDVPLTQAKLQLLQCLERHLHQYCRERGAVRLVVAIT